MDLFEKQIRGGAHEDRWRDFVSGARAFSTSEIERMVVDDLPILIEAMPSVNGPVHSFIDVEHLPAGTYRLSEPPTIDFWESLPNFMDQVGEVQLLKIEHTWLMVLHDHACATLPVTLQCIAHEERFRFMFHSHPGKDENAGYPSDEDLDGLDSTPGGVEYIATYRGLLAFRRPSELPGGYSHSQWRRAWEHWVVNDQKLTEEEFESRGAWNVREEFLRKFYGFEVIPWSDRVRIQRILDHA